MADIDFELITPTPAQANDAVLVRRGASAPHTGALVTVTDLAAASHTHTASNITNFSEAVDDRVAALVVAGANMSIIYNDTFNTLTFGAVAGGGATNLTWTAATSTVNSDTGTDAVLTVADGTNPGLMTSANFTKLAGVATGATANSSDASLRDRASHTGDELDNSFAIADSADPTKRAVFDVSVVSAASTRTLTVPNSSGQILISAGGQVITGLKQFPAGATGQASLRIPHGVAPTTPTDGDVWTTTGGFFARINGVDVDLAAAGGGGVSDGDKGDITVTASGATWTIDNGVVSLAKMADMATSSLIYRKTAGSGAPEVNTLATLKTDLGLTGTNSGDQTITLTGNVTGTGTGSFATTIAAGVVTLAMQANVATGSVFYRKTAGAGAPEVQTLATLKTDLGLTGTNSGDQTITLTGEVTGTGTGSFATTLLNSAVIGKVLTGYASGAGTVAATDTILQAIQKLNGNDALKANIASPTFTGTVTFPTSTLLYDIRAGFVAVPTSSQVLDNVMVPRTVQFAANFAGSLGFITTNPTASFAIDVQDDGVSIGTITISTGGAYTFTTTSGTAKTVASGSKLSFIAPATADATAANASFTLLGAV